MSEQLRRALARDTPAFSSPPAPAVPIDWPDRLRKAADVAEGGEWDAVTVSLRFVAQEMHQWMSADEVEAIGRALLGEGEK